MIYTALTEKLHGLVTTQPSIDQIKEVLENNKGLSRAIVTVCFNSGGISINDVLRITNITDKYVHCIICELTDESIKKITYTLFNNDLNEEDKKKAERLFISTCTINYDDEPYTVIFSAKLYDGEFALISKIYEIATTEYMRRLAYISNEDFIDEMDDFATRTYNLSCFYIPAMIAPIGNIPDNVINFEPLKLFNDYIHKNYDKDSWYTHLFDYNGIIALGNCKGYESILFDEEDMNEDDDYEDDSTDLS